MTAEVGADTTQTSTIPVTGMTCSACERRVTKALLEGSRHRRGRGLLHPRDGCHLRPSPSGARAHRRGNPISRVRARGCSLADHRRQRVEDGVLDCCDDRLGGLGRDRLGPEQQPPRVHGCVARRAYRRPHPRPDRGSVHLHGHGRRPGPGYLRLARCQARRRRHHDAVIRASHASARRVQRRPHRRLRHPRRNPRTDRLQPEPAHAPDGRPRPRSRRRDVPARRPADGRLAPDGRLVAEASCRPVPHPGHRYRRGGLLQRHPHRLRGSGHLLPPVRFHPGRPDLRDLDGQSAHGRAGHGHLRRGHHARTARPRGGARGRDRQESRHRPARRGRRRSRLRPPQRLERR